MLYHNTMTLHGVLPSNCGGGQSFAPVVSGPGPFVAGRSGGRTIGRFQANYNPGSIPSIGNAQFSAVMGAMGGTSNGLMYGSPSIHGINKGW